MIHRFTPFLTLRATFVVTQVVDWAKRFMRAKRP
jgi:hypothetical protein